MTLLHRTYLVLLGLFTALAVQAQIDVSDVQEFKGNWVVKVHNKGDRLRLLQIVSLTPEGSDRWTAALRYAFIENTPRNAAPGRLERTASGFRLTFTTRADSTVVADYNRSGVFSGSFTYGGKTVPTDISPVTDDEFAELREAERAKRQRMQTTYGVRSDSRVELIYLESTNYSCPFCRLWEKEYLLSGKLPNSPEGRQVKLTRVGTGRYISDGFLPDNLRPHRATLEARAKNLFRATPSFILMVDDRPVSWGVGLVGWDSRVHPALVRVAEEKIRAR